MNTKMTQDIFEHLILSYGAKPEHWPLEIKEEMQKWTQINPTATSFIQHEHAFESILDSYTIPASDQNNAKNIKEILKKITHEPTFSLQGIFFPLFPKLSILALTLLLGISIGVYSQPEETNTFDSNELLNTAFSYTLNDSEINL